MPILPEPVRRRLERRAKRRAIRGYLKILPRMLRREYGATGPFTPEKVERMVGRHKALSMAYLDYALAIFCDDEKLKAWGGKLGGRRHGPR